MPAERSCLQTASRTGVSSLILVASLHTLSCISWGWYVCAMLTRCCTLLASQPTHLLASEWASYCYSATKHHLTFASVQQNITCQPVGRTMFGCTDAVCTNGEPAASVHPRRCTKTSIARRVVSRTCNFERGRILRLCGQRLAEFVLWEVWLRSYHRVFSDDSNQLLFKSFFFFNFLS